MLTDLAERVPLGQTLLFTNRWRQKTSTFCKIRILRDTSEYLCNFKEFKGKINIIIKIYMRFRNLWVYHRCSEREHQCPLSLRPYQELQVLSTYRQGLSMPQVMYLLQCLVRDLCLSVKPVVYSEMWDRWSVSIVLFSLTIGLSND